MLILCSHIEIRALHNTHVTSVTLTSAVLFCPEAIERHVRHTRPHRTNERDSYERRQHGRTRHGVHTSPAGSATIRHGDIGILWSIRDRAELPRVDRDDPGPRGERDTHEPGVRQPRHRQGHRFLGNAVKDRRQRGVRRTGFRGRASALREAATRPNLHECEG